MLPMSIFNISAESRTARSARFRRPSGYPRSGSSRPATHSAGTAVASALASTWAWRLEAGPPYAWPCA